MQTPTNTLPPKKLIEELDDLSTMLHESNAVGGILDDYGVRRELAMLAEIRARVARASICWEPAAFNLPDDDITVLLYDDAGAFTLGYRDAGVWRDEDGATVFNVTFWQHLPEPPDLTRPPVLTTTEQN